VNFDAAKRLIEVESEVLEKDFFLSGISKFIVAGLKKLFFMQYVRIYCEIDIT